jgi:hypothetical protein
MNWRRLVLGIHRDAGYFFTGVALLYCISGIAVNHADDWDPNYVVKRRDVHLELPNEMAQITESDVLRALATLGETESYRTFDFPSDSKLKVYLGNGDILVNLGDGSAVHETIGRRPLLFHVNRLHLRPAKWWKAFSDVFAVTLIGIVVSGVCLAKGKQGLGGRGKWFVAAGVLAPVAATSLL